MRISVKPIHTYKELALDVNEGDSIAEVKQQIQDKEGIPPERQCLIFPPSKLQNGRTLSSYNIPAESTVLLDVARLEPGGLPEVHVRTSADKSYVFKMDLEGVSCAEGGYGEQAKVGDLRRKVVAELQLPAPHLVRLAIPSSGVILGDDSSILSVDHGIIDGSVLDLQVGMTKAATAGEAAARGVTEEATATSADAAAGSTRSGAESLAEAKV